MNAMRLHNASSYGAATPAVGELEMSQAGADYGTALIWHGDTIMDTLTSNGVPTCFDDGGTVHAALAHTWQLDGGQRDGGSYGTARVDEHGQFLREGNVPTRAHTQVRSS